MPLTHFQKLPLEGSEEKNNKTIDIKSAVKYLALALLILAYIAGHWSNQDKTSERIIEKLPGKSIKKIESNPDIYKVLDTANSKLDSWLLVTKQQGWGGPMHTGTLINEEARIKEVLVLSHKETPSFFKALVDQGFFKQYQNKSIEDAFQIDKDIDAVSGATISSRAIADAVRKSAHDWGRDHLQIDIARQPVDWKVGPNEFILILFLSVISFSSFMLNFESIIGRISFFS